MSSSRMAARQGIVVRDLVTGTITSHSAHAVILATGGYGNAFFLSTNAKGCNVTATYRAYKKGAGFANPCFTQIHPTCIPVSGDYQSKLTLMSESLRNDGRVWVPKTATDAAKQAGRHRRRRARLLPRAQVPRVRQPVAARHRVARREGAVRRRPWRRARRPRRVLRFPRRDQARRLEKIAEKYGNLFEMYERITGEDPYRVPMRIYPAVHYTMGGLWVDYHLQTTIPGLVLPRRSELLRPRREPARRVGADAGPRRRLLHHPVHARQLPRRRASESLADPKSAAFKTSETDVKSEARQAARHPRQALGRFVPQGARPRDVGRLRHGAQQGIARSRDRQDHDAARGVLVRRHRAGHERLVQPIAREGRPRRRLPRVQRAGVHATRSSAKRAAAVTSASSTRSTARRSATTRTSVTSRCGSTPAPASRPRSATSSRSCSTTSSSRLGVTSERSRSQAPHLASAQARRRPASSSRTRSRRFRRTRRSSRCSTSSTSS